MDKLKNIVLLLLGLAGGLAAVELSLTLLNQPKFYKDHSFPAQFAFVRVADGDIAYFNIPSRRIRFIYDGNPRGYFGKDNEVDHITNSWGFRGSEFSVVKPLDVFRIAFLGDSFTFGEGVRFEDTYPEQAALLLNKRYRGSGVKFESYNFGVGGYNTTQELFTLKNIALNTRPDLVVLKYDLSDAEPRLLKVDEETGMVTRIPRWFEEPGRQLQRSPPDKFIYKFRLPRFIWQILKNRRYNKQTVAYYRSIFREDSPGWQESRRALREIINICRQNNIPCYVIFFPVLYRLNGGYPFNIVHLMVKKEAESANAVFVDLFPLLKGRNAAGLWVHPADHHPNEIVNRIAAEAIVNEISGSIKKNN